MGVLATRQCVRLLPWLLEMTLKISLVKVVLVRCVLLCVVDCNGNNVPQIYHSVIDDEDVSSGKVYVLSFPYQSWYIQMARMQER